MTQPMLFTPLEIRGVRLKNRVVVAPMHQYSAVEGFATDWHLVNAGKYAQGGAGLVIMESTKVARNGCGTVGDTGLWNDGFIPALARCAAFIKAHGAVAGIQLGHSGGKARLMRPWEGGKPLRGDEPEIFDWEGWELVAPSAVPHTEKSPAPRALSHNEVRDLAVKWGEAAARANTAGFDVLEIHAAHGYLIHQFLSPVANIRTDEYGGSELKRMRFAIEVAECVRAVWPADKPLFMRLSCEDDAGWGPDESVRLARRPKARGVDVIDCSSGGTLAYSSMDGARSEIRLPGSLCRKNPPGSRRHNHGGGAYRACRPGGSDLEGRPCRPDRARPRDHVQSQLADGRGTEARRRSQLRPGAAALFLLARQARQICLRGQAIDMGGRTRGSRRTEALSAIDFHSKNEIKGDSAWLCKTTTPDFSFVR